MDVAPIEFQVRLVEDAVWKRVYATTPEQAAAAFVAEREADGGWQLAVNRRAALVVVAASTGSLCRGLLSRDRPDAPVL
ncbi:MAG: hypothetical protein IPL91_14435 [Hyphomicrobium sp.]|nr:hypothetical protein [Hyphomicrobium sp.]